MGNPSKVTTQTILEAAKLIPSQAERDAWVITLDKDEGALYFSPEKIPTDAQLFQVTDEYAIYLDSKNALQGVMIECYGSNFVKHHLQFEDINEVLFGAERADDESIVTITPNPREKETIKFRNMLEDALVSEAVAKQVSRANA